MAYITYNSKFSNNCKYTINISEIAIWHNQLAVGSFGSVYAVPSMSNVVCKVIDVGASDAFRSESQVYSELYALNRTGNFDAYARDGQTAYIFMKKLYPVKWGDIDDYQINQLNTRLSVKYGIEHTDMHQGNIAYDQGPNQGEIVALDFGLSVRNYGSYIPYSLKYWSGSRVLGFVLFWLNVIAMVTLGMSWGYLALGFVASFDKGFFVAVMRQFSFSFDQAKWQPGGRIAAKLLTNRVFFVLAVVVLLAILFCSVLYAAPAVVGLYNLAMMISAQGPALLLPILSNYQTALRLFSNIYLFKYVMLPSIGMLSDVLFICLPKPVVRAITSWRFGSTVSVNPPMHKSPMACPARNHDRSEKQAADKHPLFSFVH